MVQTYNVITPARNEAEHLSELIESMRAQTLRPARWIIVNDGSTDNTASIMDAASRVEPWIVPIHRTDRGFRQAGTGVIQAFYDGFEKLGGEPWEYLVKLDADLSFAPDYFERCLSRFRDEPLLGIGGGLICLRVEGELHEESTVDPSFHVRGATKIYRYACWNAIEGLIRAPGWDAVDEIKANMLGWRTRTFRDIRAFHHRPTGRAYGIWRDYVKGGEANFIAGYHPAFMLVKCLRRLLAPPYVTGASGLAYGYVRSYFRGIRRVPDPAYVKYFREQQFRRLCFRKSLWS